MPPSNLKDMGFLPVGEPGRSHTVWRHKDLKVCIAKKEDGRSFLAYATEYPEPGQALTGYQGRAIKFRSAMTAARAVLKRT